MSKIIANFSHYIISNYKKGEYYTLEKMLSVFDGRRYKAVPIGMIYDDDKNELRIPRGFSSDKLSNITGRDVKVIDKPFPFDKIDIELYKQPRETLQIKIIAFLCGLGKYEYTKKHSQVFCDLNTGKGKTYCAIATISYFKSKTIIFTPSRISKVADQWYESILEYTNKKEKDILVVKGSKVCLDILENKYDDKEIFIFHRATVTSFAKQYGWDKFQEVIEKTKAGVKIIDEAHLDFVTNVKIDCYSNIKRNIYLTSSAGRGDYREDKIFKLVFDNVPILGKELISKEDNYIIMVIFKFNHNASYDQRLSCKTKEGLSTSLYSNYLVDPKGAKYEFFTALDKALTKIFLKYREKEGKLLILGSTREFLNTIQKFLHKNYEEYSVGIYTSDIDKKIRHKELDKDIILATDKGLGAGADIFNLQFTINLIPYSNKIYADQISGRLRDIGDVFYMEIVNTGFPEAASQFVKRSDHLVKKAKDSKLITVKV